MHTIYTNHIENTRERSERDHETLLQALAETRAEVIELRVRQRVYERCLLDMERQLAELRVHQKDDRRQKERLYFPSLFKGIVILCMSYVSLSM